MKRLLTLLALALATATSFGATLNPIQLLNPAGSTAGQAIVSTGPSTAPAWAPVTATALVAQAANTVVANVTAASASPTAVALPSCSTANSALKYTTSTGFSCGTTYALTSGTLAQFAATTSAQLLGVISDETGTGSLVFGTGPTISGATISGGAISNSPISGNTGSFTTLSASSAVSGAGFTSLLSPYAPLASPGLTGAPTAPTAVAGTSTTQLATTAFAQNAVTGGANSGSFTSLAAASNSAVFATNTSAQSIPNSAYTTITGWTTTFDRNSNFVASTGVFTAPRAGYYLVSAGMTTGSYAWPAGAAIHLGVSQNGTQIATAGAIVSAAVTTSMRTTLPSVLVKCALNDTIVLQIFQSQGGAVSLSSAVAANQWLSIMQVP